MAAITLKDLMDPLTKIAAATERTSQKIDAVVAAVTGTAATTLNQEIVKELKTQTDLLKAIVGNTKSGSITVEGKSINSDKLKEGAEAIKLLGGGAASLASGLLSFILVPRGAITKFSETIKDVMSSFDSIDEAKVKAGAESFNLISATISEFAKGLSLSAALLVPSILGAKILSFTIEMIIPAFSLIGEREDTIKKGAVVLSLIGSSIQTFSKSLILAAIGSAIGLIFAPIIITSIILIGGAFALLGKFDKSISAGADSLGKIGKSLVFFSAGLVTFTLASLAVLINPKVLLIMVSSLVLIGGAFAILGKFGPLISLGVKPLKQMGTGLLFFSGGVLALALVSRFIMTNPMMLLTMAGTILLIGGAFALLGLASGLIAAGAVAIGLIGIGLIALAGGLYFLSAAVKSSMDLFKPSEIDSEKTNIQIIIGGIFNALIINPLKIAAVYLAAPALVLASLALILMSAGLYLFGKVYKNPDVQTLFQYSGEKSMLGYKMSNLEKVLNDIALSFTLNPAKIASMYLSFPAFIGASIALILMSAGVKLFSIVYSSEKVKDLFKESSAVSSNGNKMSNLEKVLNDIALSFTLNPAKIASMYLSFPAFIGASIALMTMSRGVSKFSDVYEKIMGDTTKQGMFAPSTADGAIVKGFFSGKRTMSNLEYMLNVIALSFTLSPVKIASMYASFPVFIGAGLALINLAKGLNSFKNIISDSALSELTGDGTKNNRGKIYTVLTSVMSSFKKVAEDNGITGASSVKSFLFGGNNPVAGGIEAAKGAGRALKDIADGVKVFGDLENLGVDLNQIGPNIKTIVTLVGDAFAHIGKGDNSKSALFGLIKWDKSKVEKGIDAVKGAGKELSGIATGLKTFASLENPAAIADSIKTIFTSVGDTFTFYYEKPKFRSQLDHMKGFITEISLNAKNGYIHKAAEGMNNIAKAVNSIDKDKAEAFANLFKGAGDLTNNQAAFNALLEAVEDIREALSGGNIGNTAVSPVGVTASPVASNESKELTPLLNNINTALSRLNGTMSSLPAQIQSIKIVIPD